MKKEKIFYIVSVMLNVLWIIMLFPYGIFSLLTLMGTDGFLYPHTKAYEILVYTCIFIFISVNIFIIAGIILSFYYRKNKKVHKSIIVQLFPIIVFILGVAASYIVEYYR